jgi:hypothetical protein
MVVTEQFGRSGFHSIRFFHSSLQVMTLDILQVIDEIEAVAERVAHRVRTGYAGRVGQCAGKICGLNQVTLTKDGGLKECVIELSDIPWPRMPL